MFYRPDIAARVAFDARSAEREGLAGIQRRQHARLQRVVDHARTWSRFYREKFAHVPRVVAEVGDLPVSTKPELMGRFDDWVTDPSVSFAGAAAFTSDQSRIGTLYLDRYFACTTSGVTGRRAILLKDAPEISTLSGLRAARLLGTVFGRGVGRDILRRGLREALVVATGGHFAGVASVELARRMLPLPGNALRVFPVTASLSSTCRELEAYDPVILVGYPSAVRALADEQAAGRLRISPTLVATAGETLTEVDRRVIGTAFDCRVTDYYAASEALALAFECEEGSLHLNEDWFVIEGVDEDGRPAPPGVPSATTLVTNLANRVQPLIRYDLGDSITRGDGRCACQSPLATIRVHGRSDDVLHMTGGALVLPLALATVIESTPGVARFQAIQTAPDVLRVRLACAPDADDARTWREVESRVGAWLRGLGAEDARVERDETPPARDARSGKMRMVMRARETATEAVSR